uniref:Inactive serine protease PAMR1 n=1 Tax=Oryzias latipes TaxID=8090 RepID=A0A3P9MKL3_ORYLA
MLPAGRGLHLGQTHGSSRTNPWTNAFISGEEGWLLSISLFFFIFLPLVTAWPYDYRYHCPGPEWSVMCRGCCEYNVIRCKCPLQGTQVGYAVPCCRNAINECDPCIIHPGCSIFENCRRCNNGTWGPRDDFFINGQYCAECRPGWSGGDCMKCGGVIRKRQGHLVLESYPNNARCEWTIQVDRPFTVELRFMMLSLEFHPSCRYDYVEVRDGDSINSRIIGRFCGNNKPAAVHSTGNSLHVLFVSDGYKNFDGFFATFQESSACSSSPCLHDGTCILDSSYTYHCACLAGYTGKRCENVPVEKVCTLPPKPEHGDHFLVYGPNDVLIALQYLCFQPFELSGASQRTCLPNNTWSGTAPVCTQVNNTLTESEKEKTKEKEIYIYSDKDLREEVETNQPNSTQEEENVGEKDSGPDHTTTIDNEENNTAVVPKKNDTEDGFEGEFDGRNTETGKPNEGGKSKFDKDPENDLYTVDEKVPAAPMPPKPKEDSSDLDTQQEKDITKIVVIKDKGQAEMERKDEQVNGKRDPAKFGPNDTKLRTVLSEGENTVESFELEMMKNSTQGSRNKEKENNTIGSPIPGRKLIPSRVNVTQFTLYRAGEDSHGVVVVQNGLSEKESTETAKELEKDEKEKETERDVNQSFTESSCPPLPRLSNGYHQVVPELEPKTVEFRCNHSYALSGSVRRICQKNGTWSGQQPMCVRACREPKVSELVRQRVLAPQVPSRKTPVHKLLTASLGQRLQSEGPTKAPEVLPQLPQGFHNLYTHIEYECVSQYYQHSGSSRRTCLKTGKWSGRHVSCSPVCGKHAAFDPERPEEALWPWLAAIYRCPTKNTETKVTKTDGKTESPKKGGCGGSDNLNQASDWQLVCSAALVNQRSLVVAAHCVTELGKVYPVDAATVSVVVGKHYRDDHRKQKGLQWLRVASIAVHPNYDPNILDSDIAVIKLIDKARIGEKVLPLCLSGSEEEEMNSGQGLVTGWSPMSDSSLGPDEKARVGLVHLADIVPCEQQYARNGVPVSVTDNMLCASQRPDYNPSNICPSDTGGILVLPEISETQTSRSQKSSQVGRDSKRLWRLLGLVSFGYDQGECDPDLYTVYTRVANFKDWIESNMK